VVVDTSDAGDKGVVKAVVPYAGAAAVAAAAAQQGESACTTGDGEAEQHPHMLHPHMFRHLLDCNDSDENCWYLNPHYSGGEEEDASESVC
jgi:hypothetical protein